MHRCFQLNKRLPYFFRDRSTEYFGLIHSALFGSESVELEEAEKLLGISKETIAQLRQYEEEREDMEASRSKMVCQHGQGLRSTICFIFICTLPTIHFETSTNLNQSSVPTGEDPRDCALLRSAAGEKDVAAGAKEEFVGECSVDESAVSGE